MDPLTLFLIAALSGLLGRVVAALVKRWEARARTDFAHAARNLPRRTSIEVRDRNGTTWRMSRDTAEGVDDRDQR